MDLQFRGAYSEGGLYASLYGILYNNSKRYLEIHID